MNQAKLLSLEEALVLTNGTDIWVEYQHAPATIGSGLVGAATFVSVTEGYKERWFHLHGRCYGLKTRLYNINYRFWTARPSEEQYKSISWDGEYNEWEE